MLTETEYIAAFEILSDQYEGLKDVIYKNMYVISPVAQELLGKLSQFRDTACTALSASHNHNLKNN